MSGTYIPGTPNAYFPKHKYCGIPVNRNIQPIGECALHHHPGSATATEKSIVVDILTPEHLWATFQLEAEDMLKADGQWIADDRACNRRINAAYARLWLADRRFQWAGLAAFASKQVGCGLLHSADIVEKNRRQRERIEASLGHGSAPGIRYGATMKQAVTELGGSDMVRRLGFGNKHLFLDIYPLHRFYMERGLKEFRACLPKRQNKRYAVAWEIDRDVLPFATPFREIVMGFEQADIGNLNDSAKWLAQHEQVNILQKIIYDDTIMQRLLAWNQFSWASDLPTGDYEEIKLTLSAQCKARTGFTSWFSKDRSAKLWIAAERMKFVLGTADQFDRLLNGRERARVEDSLQAIAAGGGVR